LPHQNPHCSAATFIYIHGGGWVNGTKEDRNLEVMPYLEMGMNVINVEYRLAKVAHAPAAVEDARYALRWVIDHAKERGVDPNRIVVGGGSAGAHLALLAAMLPRSAGFDRLCPGPDNLKVAAVVSWYGVADLSEGMDDGGALTWLGSTLDRDSLAKRISPLTYVTAGLPPMFLIHGDADPTVPYSQSVRLHQALVKAGAHAVPVSVTNLPAVQDVSGTVAVGNFPATQQVTGTLTTVGRAPSEYVTLVHLAPSGSGYVRQFPNAALDSVDFAIPGGRVLVVTDINVIFRRSVVSDFTEGFETGHRPENRTGYVASEYPRSPMDYRARLVFKDGK
jgi:acetyl esterase/lipase